jgi:hypothetical protein
MAAGFRLMEARCPATTSSSSTAKTTAATTPAWTYVIDITGFTGTISAGLFD